MQRQCKRSFVFSQQMSQPRRLSFAGELSALLPTPKAHAAAACGGALCSVAHPSWSLRRTDTCFSSHPHTRPSLLIPAPLPFHCRSLTALLALKKGGTEYCQTLTSCGGVECILQCLDAHPTSAALHAPAINMLRAVAHNRTDALRGDAPLAAVLRTLSLGMDKGHADLTWRAIMVLDHLAQTEEEEDDDDEGEEDGEARSPSWKIVLCKSAAPEALVGAMGAKFDGKEDIDCTDLALRTLTHLATGEGVCKERCAHIAASHYHSSSVVHVCVKHSFTPSSRPHLAALDSHPTHHPPKSIPFGVSQAGSVGRAHGRHAGLGVHADQA